MTELWNGLKAYLPKLSTERIWIALLILVGGIILVKILLSLFRRVLQRCKIERGLYHFLLTLMRILLYVILGLILAGTLGINVSSVIAVLSVASLALSLAVQGVLSNLAGSLQVLMSHPFHVNDYVEIGDTGGTVTEIGLIYTKITTYDNKEIFVPNKDVAACKIINYTAATLRRVDLFFTAAYSCPVEQVKAALLDAARALPLVLDAPEPVARVNQYKDSGIEYVVRAWCKTEDYWTAYYDLIEKGKELFDARGIEMTYPHLNVHMDSQQNLPKI